MATTLHSLARWVTESNWPRLQCPDCEIGSVGLEATQTFKDSKSVEFLDRVRRNLEAPDDLTGTFTGTLRCDNAECRRQIVVAGDWLHGADYDDEEGRERFVDFFLVKYLNPPLRMIHPPDRTPAPVREAIDAASELLWLNPSASANQLRQAVEHLLTACGVRKTHTSARGQRTRMTTHQRIVTYRGTRRDVADSLEAVKWIGNSGSHEADLTPKDVLNGAALLGLALRRLFDDTDATLLASAKAINRRRGLPRKGSRS